MISIDKLYANKNRLCDIVKPISVEYDDGQKVVKFTRYGKDKTFQLPIEMFIKNFERVPDGF